MLKVKILITSSVSRQMDGAAGGWDVGCWVVPYWVLVFALQSYQPTPTNRKRNKRLTHNTFIGLQQ
jgi:hypothetical protein